jgi:hypothetical protein
MFNLMLDAGLLAAGATAKGALYGLLTATLVLFVARRFRLFVRHDPVRRIVAASYYLYVPLVFVCVGSMWTTVSTARKEIATQIESVRPEIANLTAQATEGLWSAVLHRAPQGDISIRDVVLVVTRDYVEQRFFAPMLQDPRLPESLRAFAGTAAGGVSRATVAALEDRILDALAGQTSVSPALLRAVWETKILRAMHDGLVVDIVGPYIDRQFGRLETWTVLIGLLLILPVVLETTAAMLAVRRRRPLRAEVANI